MASQVQEGSAENESVFEGSLPIGEKLERARTELLDLSARNRLLNMPRSAKSAKTVDIVDEKGAEIHRLLAVEQKVFTFLPGRVEETEDGETDPQDGADPTLPALIQPEDELDGDGNAARHVDTKLQTRLTSKGLQKRLLDMFYDARTLEEEQGVNILFLAIGDLKWIDPQNAANVRRAPLVLVPVSLERGSAGEKFKLRARTSHPTSRWKRTSTEFMASACPPSTRPKASITHRISARSPMRSRRKRGGRCLRTISRSASSPSPSS